MKRVFQSKWFVRCFSVGLLASLVLFWWIGWGSWPIDIGAYAWICARAIVLPGVVCGDGAVLGAGAVTSKDLEKWTVYAGNPAREVGSRNVISDV